MPMCSWLSPDATLSRVIPNQLAGVLFITTHHSVFRGRVNEAIYDRRRGIRIGANSRLPGKFAVRRIDAVEIAFLGSEIDPAVFDGKCCLRPSPPKLCRSASRPPDSGNRNNDLRSQSKSDHRQTMVEPSISNPVS